MHFCKIIYSSTNRYLLSPAWEKALNYREINTKIQINSTWMENDKPKMLLASQCFLEAYHTQKKVPGIAATTWDLVNSISNAV